MVKLIETTELMTGLTSFRTEIDKVDTSLSLQERYEQYKRLVPQDDNPSAGSQAPKA